MHDFALASEIAEVALRTASENGGGRVSRVHVSVGRSSHIDPGILADAFTMSVSGTAADGAILDITRLPATYRCTRCGREFDSNDWPATRCSCGSEAAAMPDRGELAVLAVDVEEPGD